MFLEPNILEEAIRKALDKELPYFEKGRPQESIDHYLKLNPHRPASVLVCLSCPESVQKLEEIAQNLKNS